MCSGKKRRGRPKKSRSDRAEAEMKIVCMASTSTTNTASYAIPLEKELKKFPVLDPLPTDSSSNVNNVGTGDQNSAAEVLLELSNAGICWTSAVNPVEYILIQYIQMSRILHAVTVEQVQVTLLNTFLYSSDIQNFCMQVTLLNTFLYGVFRHLELSHAGN